MPEALKVEEIGQVCVVFLAPDYSNLDGDTLESIRDQLFDITARETCRGLVLDFSETKFFGTSFIEMMFRVWHRFRQRDGKFALCGLQPYLVEVLHVGRLDKLWKICDDKDSAVAELTP